MIRFVLMLLSAAIFSSYSFADSDHSAENTSGVSESAQDQAEPHGLTTETHFSSGVLYYRDPETGEMTVPPSETMRVMQIDAVNFSDEGLEVEILADGSKMVDLQGRFQMSSTVHRGPNGLVHQCTSQPHTHLATSHSGQESPVREEQ